MFYLVCCCQHSTDWSVKTVMNKLFFLSSNSQLVQRILEAHANLKDLTLMEAKMNYIKAWQSLPEFGISLFVVKFMGHKKEELLGIAYNRLMRMDIATGDHIKTWRYNTMKVYLHYGDRSRHSWCDSRVDTAFTRHWYFMFGYFHSGMEHQLGSEAHDGAVRGGQHNICLSIGRLQGDTRVYRRIHILFHAFQRSEPVAERGTVPQTDRWLVINWSRRVACGASRMRRPHPTCY